MVEHEIHHRGQIYVFLSMLGIHGPPLYGLTAEEVRARSTPQSCHYGRQRRREVTPFFVDPRSLYHELTIRSFRSPLPPAAPCCWWVSLPLGCLGYLPNTATEKKTAIFAGGCYWVPKRSTTT
jgi:hypothetical protein